MTNPEKTQLIETARKHLLSSPIQNKYSFEEVTEEKFWNIYETQFSEHAPLDLFFVEKQLYTKDESLKLHTLNNTPTLEDNLLLKDKGTGLVIAMFRGWQRNYDTYYMQFTSVHRDYRRLGIYSEIIDKILTYTKELGFARVSSCHAPFNNAVLIAKLKKDFKITQMEIDPALGINIWLCYFHNQELKKAFEFRCGSLTFSKNLFDSSLNTAEQLATVLMENR